MPASPVDLLSRAAGDVLASGARILGATRGRTKPLHPEGELRRATVTRLGGATATGVGWLDAPGRDEVVVRLSRGIGLPDALPDVHGLAIRVDLEGSKADLLLATTGVGRVTRYFLIPTRTATGRPLTTLLPYRSPRGALQLAAVPESEHAFGLSWARPLGTWVPFGRLELGEQLRDDRSFSFDPVVNELPGLSTYSWVRRLREPAYWAARARSHRRTPQSDAGK